MAQENNNNESNQSIYTKEQIDGIMNDFKTSVLPQIRTAIEARQKKTDGVTLVTLQSAPTSSTLTYTVGTGQDGKTYAFKIGDEVRVPDAENASEGANGYVYYKLYDIQNGTAYWDLGGSGGSGGGALGKIRVNLAAIVNGSQASSSQLNGVTITLRNTTDDEQVGQPVTWAGLQVVFPKLTPLKAYRISVSSKTGWKRDYEYQDIASLDIAADITKTFEFSALEYTVEMTSNQDAAGTPDADIDRTSTGVYLTARYSYGGSTVSFGSNLHHGDTVKVPSDVDTSTIEIVSSSNVTGYAKQAGVDTINKKLAVAYSTTIVYASVSSNQSSAVLSGVVCKVDGAAVSTSVGKKVPTGSSFTFATENDLAGYQKVVTNDGTASGTSQIVGVAYNAELVSVALAADTGSPDLSSVTINIYDASDDSVIATGTGSITNQPIASGTSYYVGVSNDVEGYLAPDNTSARTAGSGEDASHTASFEYVAAVDGEVTVVPTARELTYTGSSQDLVTAGEGTGTMMYKLGDGEWSSTIPSAINAGTYTVKYKAAASHGYYESDEGTVSVTIAKAAQVYTVPEARSLTYSGDSQYLTTTGSATYGTLYYSADGTNWSTTRVSKTSADTYTSYWKITGDSNHEDVASTSVSTTISKATPSYTAPTAMSGLEYNGTSQTLLSAGSTSDGTIEYSSDNTNWSTSVPAASSVNTHRVYWRLIGDSNHTDKSATYIDVTISKGTSAVNFIAKTFSLDYNPSPNSTYYVKATKSGWEKCPTSVKTLSGYNIYRSVSNKGADSSSSVMKLTFTNNTGSAISKTVKIGPATESTCDFVYISAWDASDISPTNTSVPSNALYSGSGKTAEWTNYTLSIPTGTHSIQVVYKKDGSVNNSPDCGYFAMPAESLNQLTVVTDSIVNGITTTGDGSLSYSSNNGSVASVDSSGNVTISGIGTATITATMASTSNYNSAYDTYTITVTASKTPATYTAPTARSRTYNGSSQTLMYSGSSSHGTIQYSSSSSSGFSTTIPSETNAGTYNKYWRLVADTYHFDVSSTLVQCSISKASRTISFTTKPASVKVGNSVTVAASPSAGSGDGTISYSSGSTSIATVSGSSVTGVAYGTSVITASVSEGTNYLSASTTYTIKVYSGGIDMGLPSGVIWADSNVGASTPYAYECQFFSWGNTDGHTPTSSSSFGSYSWGTGNDTEPYVSSSGAALTGNISLSQDAARVNLGSPWRMPTSAEFAELFNNIKYINADGTEVSSSSADKRVTVNGILGLYLESKINGNRLFFACCGYGHGTSWYDRGSYGGYWASTLYSSTGGRFLYFRSSGVNPQDYYYRFYGFTVRAVQ